MTAKEICALAFDEAGFSFAEDGKTSKNKGFFKNQVKNSGFDGNQKSEGLGDKPFDLAAHDKQHHHGHYDGGTCKYRDEAVQKGLITKEQASQKTGQNQSEGKMPPQITPEQLMQQGQSQASQIDPKQLQQEIESGEKKLKDIDEGIKSERKNIHTAVGDIVTESALQEAVVNELNKKLEEGDARANEELEKLKEINRPYDHNEKFNELKEEIGSFEANEGESYEDMVERYNDLLAKIDPNEYSESEQAALKGLANFIRNRIEGGNSGSATEQGNGQEQQQYDEETGLPQYVGSDGKTYVDISGLGMFKAMIASYRIGKEGKDIIDRWGNHFDKWKAIVNQHNTDSVEDQNRRTSVNAVASATAEMTDLDLMKQFAETANIDEFDKHEVLNMIRDYESSNDIKEKAKIFSRFNAWRKKNDIATENKDGNSPSQEFNVKNGDDFNKGLPEVSAIFPEDENVGKIISSEGVQKSVDDLCQQFGIDAKVGEFKDAPTSIRMEMKIPQGGKIGPLFNPEFKRQLNAALGADARITQENGSVFISFTKKKADKVFFSEAFKNPEVVQKCKDMSLPMITGKDENGNWIVEDLAKQPHQMVSGATGSGKSVDLNMALLTLMMTKTPKEAGVFIIDGKGTEFVGFKNLPHLIHPVVNGLNNTKGVKSALLSLQDEMKKRLEKLGSYRDIATWNAAHPEDKMKPIEAIIDEYAALQSADPSIQAILDDIGARARAAGIHMRLATQSPSKKLMGQLEAHFPTQHIYKAADKGSSLATMGDTRATQLLGAGDGYVKNGSSINRMRGAFAHNDSIGRAIEHFTGEFPEEFRENQPQKQDVIPQDGGNAKNYTVDLGSVGGDPSTALQYTSSNILSDAKNMTKAEALGRLKQAYEHYVGSISDETARNKLANAYNTMMNEMAANNHAPFKQDTVGESSVVENAVPSNNNGVPPQVRPEDIVTPEQAQQIAQRAADKKKFEETHAKYHPKDQKGEEAFEDEIYNESIKEIYKAHEEGKLTGEKFRKKLSELDEGHKQRRADIADKYKSKESDNRIGRTTEESGNVPIDAKELEDAGNAYGEVANNLINAKNSGADASTVAELEKKLQETAEKYKLLKEQAEIKKTPEQKKEEAGEAYSKLLADISRAQSENSPYLEQLKEMLPIVSKRYQDAIKAAENNQSKKEVEQKSGALEKPQTTKTEKPTTLHRVMSVGGNNVDYYFKQDGQGIWVGKDSKGNRIYRTAKQMLDMPMQQKFTVGKIRPDIGKTRDLTPSEINDEVKGDMALRDIDPNTVIPYIDHNGTIGYRDKKYKESESNVEESSDEDPLSMFTNETDDQRKQRAKDVYRKTATKIRDDYQKGKITFEEAQKQSIKAQEDRDKLINEVKADETKPSSANEENKDSQPKENIDSEEERRLYDTVNTVSHGKTIAHAIPGVNRGNKKNTTPITHQDFNAISKALPQDFVLEGGENAMRDGNGNVWAHHKGGNGNGSRGWFDKNNQWHWAVNTTHPKYKGENSPEAKAAKEKWLGTNLNEAQNKKEYRNIAFGTDEAIPNFGTEVITNAVLSFFKEQ